MENLASFLRQARENKRLTLKDVATTTRIPMPYLLVLEGGEGLMSDHVYLVPFLRTYAKFLGIDPTAVVTQFVLELQQTDSRTSPPDRRVTAAAAPSAPSRLSFWALPFLLFLGLLLVGSFLWQNGFNGFDTLQSLWLTKTEVSSEQETPPPPASPPETFGTDLPPPGASTEPTAPIAVAPPSTGLAPSTPGVPSDTVPTAGAVPTQTEPTTAVTASPQSAPLVDSTGHRLNIQAISPTWVRIVVDDQSPKEMIIKAGEAREWSAQHGFTLSLGNAGGVTLNLNGQPLPPVGKAGQVVRNIHLPAATSAPAAATTLQ